jgi:glycine betaine/choline ABC-type transport system substrate-binding protein
MRRVLRAFLAALAVLAAAAFLAACGEEEETTTVQGQEAPAGEAIKRNPANASKTVTVGSKNFTEQFILGEIYAQALEAAGYKVKKELNLGSEQIAYRALRSGQVDGYPEYTGTSLTSFFDVKVQDVPKDPAQAYEQARAEYAKQGITALPQAPFDNTYRVGMLKETQKRLGGITKTSQLAGKDQDLVINGFPECKQRIDCLLGVERNYKLKFKRFLANESKYQVLDRKQADLAFVFTTDGNLASGKYVMLDDDKEIFPPYHISFGIKDEKLRQLGPDAEKVITQVQKPLTEKVMQQLNARVDLRKQKPEQVAGDFLREAGFVK